MKTQLITIVALCIVLCPVLNECLSEEILKAIGFGETQENEVVDSPTVCSDLFKTSGTCVPETSVIAKIEVDNSSFSAKVNVFAAISTAMSALADTLSSSSEDDKNSINNILSSLENTKDGCINAWSTIQQGITCYLASNKASDGSTVGTSISVNVDTDVVGPYLEACLDYIDSICLLTAGMSISTSISVTDSSFLTYESKYKTGCQTLKDNYDCGTDDCKKNRYDTIINVFFKPYEYSFFASTNVFTTITDTLKDIADDITDWFNDAFSRRLLDETNVEANSTSGGEDVKSHGENSMQDKVTASTYILSSIVSILVAFFLVN